MTVPDASQPPSTSTLLRSTAALINTFGPDSPEVADLIEPNAANRDFLRIARLGQALHRMLQPPPKRKRKKRKKHRR
jgi:hypothetical protein